MIEDSIRSGRYPFESENQKRCAAFLQVSNMSSADAYLDEGKDILIETRIHELFVLNNYLPNIAHLPGIIELDVLDSFKILCRRLGRMESGIQIDTSKEK
jgi:hypothetical protein